MKDVLVVLAVLALTGCSPPNATLTSDAPGLTGVVSVIDGDTIEIHGKRLRLSGIDAPERGRKCGAVNVYQRASIALSDHIGRRTVHCSVTGEKTHDREVGTCTVAGVDVAAQLVEEGWARDWPRYSNGAYADEEARAREAKLGLWGMDCPGTLWGSRNYSR